MKKLVLGLVFMVSFMAFGGMTAFAADDANSSLPYIVKEGTPYYESAYGFGSGRMGIVNSENDYTTAPCYAAINGYAFLDENGNIIKSDYHEETDDIIMPISPKEDISSFELEEAIKSMEEESGIEAIWVHFKSSFYRNGWVDIDNIVINDVKHTLNREEVEEHSAEQEPEEVVEHIEQEIKKENQKTAIVIDFSGSMYDNQKEVVELLETLEFNDNTTIIVFANEYEVITQEQLASRDFDVGAGTHMFKALNVLDFFDTESVIIISDLDTHDLAYEDDVELKINKRLKSVVIYDPDDGDENSIVDEVLKPAWSRAKVSRVRIR